MTAKSGTRSFWTPPDATKWEHLDLYGAHWIDPDGWLVCHFFGKTDNGTVDHIGFHVEPWIGKTDDEHDSLFGAVNDRLFELAEAFQPTRPHSGLTASKLRVMTSATEARRAAMAGLDALLGLDRLPSLVPRRRGKAKAAEVHDDRFYAQLVIDYYALLNKGPGARRKLAKKRGCSEHTIRNAVSEATRRGLWISAGAGRQGRPTGQAVQLLEREGS